MMFTRPYKEAIAAGRVTTSFRNWKRPQVKVGGEYNIPPFGAIRVTGITTTTLSQTSTRAVLRSGHESVGDLTKLLKCSTDDPVFQVDFTYLGAEPVKQPNRSADLTRDELTELVARLDNYDKKSPWAWRTLDLIHQHPATRAGDLAPRVGQELPVFKRNVRKLKTLGLTLSLEVGYQLSERGSQLLKHRELIQ